MDRIREVIEIKLHQKGWILSEQVMETSYSHPERM
jgi:hypothetical protein